MMKVEMDLLYAMAGICFVAGFCFGTAFTKYMLKDVLKKYRSVFGKVDHPLIEIL